MTGRCCPVCDLERLSPRFVLAAMGQFYPDDYSPFSDAAPPAASRADRLKRLAYATYRADYIRVVARNP